MTPNTPNASMEGLKKEFQEKSSRSVGNGGFLAVDPPIGFTAMVDNQWNWMEAKLSALLKEAEEMVIGKLHDSFIMEFYKSGERWYDYGFSNAEEAKDALEIVEEEWNDLLNDAGLSLTEPKR